MDQLVLEAKGPRKLMRSPFGQEGNGMLVVVALDRVKVPQQAVRLARDAALVVLPVEDPIRGGDDERTAKAENKNRNSRDSELR